MSGDRLHRIEQLLRLHPDAILSSQGAGTDRGDSRTLEYGPLYKNQHGHIHPCWIELERCLDLMRQERDWQRRHMLAYYQAETRITTEDQPVQRLDKYKMPVYEHGRPVYERRRDGSLKTKPTRVAKPIIRSWVSKSEAYAGLHWLESRYQIDPSLPTELLREAA